MKRNKVVRGPLFSKKSHFQKIELLRRNGGLLLRLNGSDQVHSRDEKLYHETVATLPMMLAGNPRRVAILGGGDGLAAREVLHFPQAKDITLVELDPDVIAACSQQPDFAEMNEHALQNPRLKVIAGDAIKWFLHSRGKFDIIVHDIEVSFTDQPGDETVEQQFALFGAIARKLSPRGVAVVTLSYDDCDKELIEQLFELRKDELPLEYQREFKKHKHVFARTQMLLQTLFPYVRRWEFRCGVIGTHATFYLSHSPLTRLRRWPKTKPRFIRKGILKSVLK